GDSHRGLEARVRGYGRRPAGRGHSRGERDGGKRSALLPAGITGGGVEVLIGITRVRNEALIIGDTVRHYLEHCDRIVMYDDASTDDTVELAMEAGGDQIEVIRGTEWRQVRRPEET